MKKTVKIYYTSDTHGFLFPEDGKKSGGLLSCFSEYKKDGNTLILDGGDTIQGSTFIKFLQENNTLEEDITYGFNWVNTDAYVLGNHDFNYGVDVLDKFIKAMKGTCITSNFKNIDTQIPMEEYKIFTMENGLKIGICGIVTDCVNLWESKENLEGIKITDAFMAAKEGLKKLKEVCDLTICLYHGGFECDLESGEILCQGNENIGYRICKELEYDILLSAHQHNPIKGRVLNNTYIIQCPPNAMEYAEITIAFENNKLDIKSSLLAPSTDVEQSLVLYYEEKRRNEKKFKEKIIGSLKESIEPVSLLKRAMEGSYLADFSNQVLLETTNAEIACTGLGNESIGLETPILLGKLLQVFPFLNTVVVLEVDARTIKKALERCASYFELEDWKIVISPRFLYPKAEHYNYDFYAGVEYTIDLEKSIGNRVSNILINGKKLENRNYKVAMSNYRATGTGGYEFFAECNILFNSKEDIQTIMMDYLKNHPELKLEHLSKINFK